MKTFLDNIISTYFCAKKWCNLTACIGLFVVLVACDQKSPPQISVKLPEAKALNELSRAIYSAHIQLDPHFVKAIADEAPLRDLLVGLMQFSPQGEVVPAVAKEIFSEDSKDWLILLDEQAKWSNGQPVTADDFVASWQRLADPKNASPLAQYLIYMGIKNAKDVLIGKLSPNRLGVTALSPKSLKIELHTANPQFPKMLAHIALLPTYQGANPSLAKPFISNGAYQIDLHTYLNLVLGAVSPDLPFQKVQYHLINTIQNPERFDIIENPLDNYHHNEVILPRLCSYFYEFNFRDPALSKKEVRQAIRSMISSSEISRDFGIANHLVLPKTFLSESPEMSSPISKASAEQIFQQFGIDANNPLKLTLTYDNQGQHSLIANRIARALGQSDLFRIRLQAVDWKQLLAKREEKAFQLIRSGWCGDYADPVPFLTPFHSASLDNKSGYANERVDHLLEQLQQPMLDPEQRYKLIVEVVRQLENDVAILPLFQYQRRISVNPEIHGIEMSNSSEVIYSKDLFRQ